MPLIPEDPVPRCGVWFLSTDWIWRSLNRVGLTRHKEDPLKEACILDDKLTYSKNPYNKIATNERELESVDAAYDVLAKETGHYRWAAFQKFVLRRVRKYFD